MPTQILAVGTDPANSSDVVIASGEQLTVGLKGASAAKGIPNGSISIQLKDDSGQYWPVGTLSFGKPVLVLAAAGTYRFSRPEGGKPRGVFSA